MCVYWFKKSRVLSVQQSLLLILVTVMDNTLKTFRSTLKKRSRDLNIADHSDVFIKPWEMNAADVNVRSGRYCDGHVCEMMKMVVIK